MTSQRLYAVEFFDLQLRFASKVAQLCGLPLADAVGRYTNLYVRLGMGPRYDPGNAEWLGFVGALVAASDRAQYAHAVHRDRIHLPAGPTPERTVGCFSYALAEPGCVRLHFDGSGPAGASALSPAERPARRAELSALLAHLETAAGDDLCIVGASWLYHVDGYRRLFPPRYLASLRAVEHPYQRMPLWGQFLRRDRSVRRDAAADFLTKVAQAGSLSDLAACFPLGVLATRAPARWFHECEPDRPVACAE